MKTQRAWLFGALTPRAGFQMGLLPEAPTDLLGVTRGAASDPGPLERP